MQIDVGKVLDEGRWTGYQKLLVLITALAIILDGLDIQLLTHAVPAMMKEWSLPRSAFDGSLGIGGLGMLLGGLAWGWLSDRIGRRAALALSVFWFAVFTVAIAGAHDLNVLTILRFLSGLGLGGALPTSAALASEYVPLRRRALAVTCTIVCVPLGGMLAATIAKYLIPAFGWRALFLVGGIVPLVVGALILLVLPESPRFLARREKRRQELIALLRKLGHNVDANATFVDYAGEHTEKGRAAFLHLFTRAYIGDTFALFGSFFFGLLVNYIAFTKFVPSLTAIGFSQPAASNGLLWWNIGGVAGALTAGLFIQWVGSRITMLTLCLIAAAGSFVTAGMRLDPQNTFTFLTMCVIIGGTLNAVQTAMYALAAHVYPTAFRGTGIGTAVAVGRIGAILAPFTAEFAMKQAGISGFFSTFGIGMVLVFFMLSLVRRHIERAATNSGGGSR